MKKRLSVGKYGRERLKLIKDKNDKQLMESKLRQSPYSPHRNLSTLNSSLDFILYKPMSPVAKKKQQQPASSQPTRKVAGQGGLHIVKPRRYRILKQRMIDISRISPPPIEQNSEPFVRIGLLGEGGSSFVFLVEQKETQKRMVMKEYKKTTTRKALKQYLIGKSLSHPNIVEFYSHKDNRIFMEYCDSDKSKCSNLQLAYKLAKAIQYMHENNVCHTDIKPKNIIVTSLGLKIIDFGESMRMQIWRKGKSGTYGYMAPEMFEDGFWNGKQVDVWSFGVVCKEWRLFGLADFCLKEKPHRPTIEEVLRHPSFKELKH